MIRPYIYAAGDYRFCSTYGAAFVNSARACGHQADVFCNNKVALTKLDRVKSTLIRLRMLPEILKSHPATMWVDVDSIFKRPVEVEPEYDIGLFLRIEKAVEHKRAAAFVFYCTDRAMEFAQALSAAAKNAEGWWFYDQQILWDTYQAIGSKYRIKLFDRDTVDWNPKSNACIFTGKGRVKYSDAFESQVKTWKQLPQEMCA